MPIIDLIARKKFEDYLVGLTDKINGFPKSQKFRLADKILQTAFEVMDDIIEIQFTKKDEREELFRKFNLHRERLKQYQRIAWRKKFISHRALLFQENQIEEVGRMISSLCRPSSSSE